MYATFMRISEHNFSLATNFTIPPLLKFPSSIEDPEKTTISRLLFGIRRSYIEGGATFILNAEMEFYREMRRKGIDEIHGDDERGYLG
jgi:hypothetical protein